MKKLTMSQATELVVAELRATLAARDAEILALHARLSVAKTVYRELRASTHVVRVDAPVDTPAPTVKHFNDRLGRPWVSHRIGNRTVSRMVQA